MAASCQVFVGNLPFSTREEDLKEIFTGVAGVASANVVTRGTRSLGYGFVDFETPELANAAVEAMHKKEVDGREISCEVAKARDPTAPRPRKRGGRRDGEGDEGEEDGERRKGGRGRRKPKGEGEGGDGRRGGRGKPRDEGEDDGEKPRGRKRNPRPKRQEPRDQTPSTDTLFVANLPFSLDNEGLGEIFTGFAVVEARVVCKSDGRSKGFGFVKFESEEEQVRALAESASKMVDDRELTVSIAKSQPVRREEQQEEQA